MNNIELAREEWNEREMTVPRNGYDSLKESRETERKEFLEVLDNVNWVKPRFGTPYFKLDMDATELAILRRKLKNRKENHCLAKRKDKELVRIWACSTPLRFVCFLEGLNSNFRAQWQRVVNKTYICVLYTQIY